MDSIVPAEDIAPLDDDGAITAVPDEEPYPVPHFAAGSTPLVRLVNFEDVQILEHLLTGEIVQAKPPAPGHRWTLAESNGWAYLDAGGRAPACWANGLFSLVVFRSGLDLYCEPVGADELEKQVAPVWLDEVRIKFNTHFASWPRDGVHHECSRLAHIVMDSPRCGVRVFFDLVDMQKYLSFSTKYGSGNAWVRKQKPKWEVLLEELNMDPLHLMRPAVGPRADEISIRTWHASFVAVLVILLHSSTTMTHK